jgi:hypothetical protein
MAKEAEDKAEAEQDKLWDFDSRHSIAFLDFIPQNAWSRCEKRNK